jgi:hypothetical protein
MNTEILKRAYRRTLEEQSGFDTDIVASRRAAVASVKRAILSRNKTNAVMDEWLNAKEEHKKRSPRK